MPSRDAREPEDPSGKADSTAALGGEPLSTDESLELRTSMGSGLLKRQPTPGPDEHVTVTKVCPQCGGEYETGDRFCPKDGAPLRPKGSGDPFIGRVIADR